MLIMNALDGHTIFLLRDDVAYFCSEIFKNFIEQNNFTGFVFREVEAINKIEFFEWLDSVIEDNNSIEGLAINFNIYEEGSNSWILQAVAAEEYDEEDDDWCCDAIDLSKQVFYFCQGMNDWKDVLDNAKAFIADYLVTGKYADILKQAQAITVGFVDGDLYLAYKKRL